jgi:uncharacterized protein
MTSFVRAATALAFGLSLAACATDEPKTSVISPDAAVAAPVPTAEALAHWDKWKANENAAWSGKEFAILKIDDAVYLDEGQSAYLTNKKQKVLQYAWTLNRKEASKKALRISYKKGKAVVTHNGKTTSYTLEETKGVKITDGIDVRFQQAQLRPGVNGLRVMVYNQANPVAMEFKGLDHFPYNPTAVVTAKFEPAAKVEGIDFQTSRGWFKRFYRMGTANFTLEGKDVKLPMYTDTDDPAKVKSLSVFFTDELTGKETYGVGRYMDIEVNGLPATVKLDFNEAYNPNCARSPHYNCPVATDKIPVELRAGEMKPPKHAS